VDEYQDINFAQYQLVRLIGNRETSICVIGDPDQAIYGFRGASASYFMRFQAEYQNTRVFTLQQNYRSSQNILDASGDVIEKNTRFRHNKLRSDITGSTKVEIYTAPTDRAEAEYVIHQIERMVGGTSHFSIDSDRLKSGDSETTQRTFADFAVLYRLNTQSRLLQEAFERSGIPYQTSGDVSLFQKEEIRKIMNMLYLIVCAENEQFSNEWSQNSTIWPVNRSDRKKAEALVRQGESLSLQDAVEYIRSNLYANGYFDKSQKRKKILEQFQLQVKAFTGSIREFLQRAALHQEADDYRMGDRVSLMTLHTAKGLEFPVVFITGCEQHLIPCTLGQNPAAIDEERRLFYVGMTRAQERLILTRARKRYIFGTLYNSHASPFLEDIKKGLKEEIQFQYEQQTYHQNDDAQLKLF
jgi:DNA helicase-2/ATP-dependent DNA helicase PcrA